MHAFVYTIFETTAILIGLKRFGLVCILHKIQTSRIPALVNNFFKLYEIIMKSKKLIVLLLFIIGIGAYEGRGQSLLFQMSDGSIAQNELSLIQKITFSDGFLELRNTGGSIDSYSLSTISKIYFGSNVSGTGAIEVKETISIYPNPVSDCIYFNNLPDGRFTVTIYRMNGEQVMQSLVSLAGNYVNVSRLPQGVYFLRVNNQVFKIVKL
jgi:hypothetical protein